LLFIVGEIKSDYKIKVITFVSLDGKIVPMLYVAVMGDCLYQL
jgi:hypothetical protein